MLTLHAALERRLRPLDCNNLGSDSHSLPNAPLFGDHEASSLAILLMSDLLYSQERSSRILWRRLDHEQEMRNEMAIPSNEL
jgi:hypothetical protein